MDVGGGTGGFAVPLAQAGYPVAVVDTSPNALAGLTQRAAEAGVADKITAVQGDADDVAEVIAPGSARLVLCHSVLEMVEEPQVVLESIRSILADSGAVSLLTANRAGAVLARVLSGHLRAGSTLLDDSDGRSGEHDTLRRRFDPQGLLDLIAACGLAAELRHGVPVVADLLPGSSQGIETDTARALRDLEESLAGISPYRDIASAIHVLARKTT